ncbi:hypothetical protein LguiA_005792 [Lonicera macranthoides]
MGLRIGIENEDKAVRLLTTNKYKTCSDGFPWASVHLDHPATFDTVAMELDAKEMVMKDLERFMKRVLVVWTTWYRKVDLDCGYG